MTGDGTERAERRGWLGWDHFRGGGGTTGPHGGGLGKTKGEWGCEWAIGNWGRDGGVRPKSRNPGCAVTAQFEGGWG